MTTNNLSRELCEICGIEPISRCDYCPRNCLGPDVCKRGESVRYPDFTQPENFVKLFELNISDLTVTVGAAVCFCNRQQLNNRNDFLKSIIQLAKYNKDIMQAIKSEVWKYE